MVQECLPRPISICKVENNNLRIVFRVAGKGTEEFSKMKVGEYLDIQGPLGNGYDLEKIAAELKAEGRSFDKAILFGGGIGVPPMLELARQIRLPQECCSWLQKQPDFS